MTELDHIDAKRGFIGYFDLLGYKSILTNNHINKAIEVVTLIQKILEEQQERVYKAGTITGQKFCDYLERTPMTNDFGRDLILKRDGKKTFVECKRYDRDTPIGRRALQLFYGVIVNMKADAGIFVTTSSFAKTAVNFASETGIELIDGYELAALMTQAFPGEGSADEYRVMCRECGDVVVFNLRQPTTEISCKNGHMVKDDSPDSLMIKLIAEAPTCEKCGSKMKLLKGHYGKFWGCSNYPECRSKKRYSGA